MRPVYKRNLSATGRLASTVTGAALVAVGYRRKNPTLAFAGLGMVARGATGFCPVTAVMGQGADPLDSTRPLGESLGGRVEGTITIARAPKEAYSYWRQLDNLPRFMSHLEQVHENGTRWSHWVARGPRGVRLEWDAEIVSDIPNELISWESIGESDVVSIGSVRFTSAPGGAGTEVQLTLQYDPPAGKVDATLARLLGDDAQKAIAEDLERFKQLVESREASTAEFPAPWRQLVPLAQPGWPASFRPVRH